MPKYRESSVDEFISRRELTTRDGIAYRAAAMPKSFNPEDRSAIIVMTDETRDSYGDIVKAAGADLYRFEKNPIALFNHKSDMPIGTWSDVQKKPQRIEGKCTVAKEGSAPVSDMVFNMMSQGILRAASIGFMPTKLEVELDDDGNPTWCYIIHEWEMYECSIVSIPANPSALARSAGDSDELRIARDYIEQVLDSFVKTPEGLLIPRSEYEKAYKVVVEKIAADETEASTVTATITEPIVVEIEKAAEPAPPELTDDVIEAFVKLTKGATLETQYADETRIVARAADGTEQGELVLPLTMTLAEIKALRDDIDARIAEAVEAETVSENKTETNAAPIVVTLEADTSQVEAAVTKVEGLFGRLVKQFPMFFPKAIEERIEPTLADPEPPAPPTEDAIAAARAKAAAVRERLVSKDLIAA